MSEQTLTVSAGWRRARADKVLASACPDHSRVALQRAFDAGLVLKGGQVISRDHAVSTGDVLTFSLPDVRPSELKAVSIPLDILYEDEHLLALNKDSGMIVHPGAGTGEDTLVHALLAHCKGELSGIGGVERPGIVHRLDRDTSGVMLVAKTDAAHRGLSEQFSSRSLQKEYLALVEGAPALLSGSIRKPIGRNPTQRHKMAVVEVAAGGRDAHTDWEVLEKYGKLASLIRCTIHTGRTHQIRVHMKALEHILIGDVVYGWKPDPDLGKQPERVMLHAEHLVVTHPITGKVLDLKAPLPTDFADMVAHLRKKAGLLVTTDLATVQHSPNATAKQRVSTKNAGKATGVGKNTSASVRARKLATSTSQEVAPKEKPVAASEVTAKPKATTKKKVAAKAKPGPKKASAVKKKTVAKKTVSGKASAKKKTAIKGYRPR